MFDFKLLENEEVEIISNESILKSMDEGILVHSVITNQRIIFLESPRDLENFRVGREIFPSVKKEIVFEVLLEDIDNVFDGDEFDTYQLKNGTCFYLADLQVRNYVQNLKNAR